MSNYTILANRERVRVFCAEEDGRHLAYEGFSYPMSQEEPTAAMPAWRRQAEQDCYMATLLAAYIEDVHHRDTAGAFVVAAPALFLHLLRTALTDAEHNLNATVAEDLPAGDYAELVGWFPAQRLTPMRNGWRLDTRFSVLKLFPLAPLSGHESARPKAKTMCGSSRLH